MIGVPTCEKEILECLLTPRIRPAGAFLQKQSLSEGSLPRKEVGCKLSSVDPVPGSLDHKRQQPNTPGLKQRLRGEEPAGTRGLAGWLGAPAVRGQAPLHAQLFPLCCPHFRGLLLPGGKDGCGSSGVTHRTALSSQRGASVLPGNSSKNPGGPPGPTQVM